MRTSQTETGSPRGNGAEWVKLRPVGRSGAREGCAGLGCMGFAVALATLAIVVARFGDSIGGAVVIGALSLATGTVGGGKVLAALGPRPRLWANQIRIGAGETFKLRWEAAGRFKDARSIEITWEGREVAIERGYDGRIYMATFTTRVVTTAVGPLNGEASIELPHVLMPSFTVRNSRVEWLFRARVRTHGWPAVEEAYLVEVLPNPRVRP